MTTAEPDGEAVLRDRLATVSRLVAEAAVASGRSAGDVKVLLATKTIEPARILQALDLGFRLIGENRVQELVAKAGDLAVTDHECHFIGHLQTNKINQVLGLVSCVQTVDSADLARRLDARMASVGPDASGVRDDRTLDVLLQVNVSGEASKSGVTLDQLPALLADLVDCRRLRVRGYMTIGLNSPDREAVRAGYRALATFRDDARRRGLAGAEDAIELSMGMSGDFVDAVAEGATIIRLGSIVFGPRIRHESPLPGG